MTGILSCKMYMAEVLGAKCISRDRLAIKNEKCEPASPPTRHSVIVGLHWLCIKYFIYYQTKILEPSFMYHTLIIFDKFQIKLIREY
jgi:hypothetical protein